MVNIPVGFSAILEVSNSVATSPDRLYVIFLEPHLLLLGFYMMWTLKTGAILDSTGSWEVVFATITLHYVVISVAVVEGYPMMMR